MDVADLRALDEIASDATPSPIEADVAGWWCKAAPDLPFRRCNVARPPLGAGDDPERARTALAEVRAWYADIGQRTIVQVSSADPSASALDAVLAAEGLSIEAPVLVLVAAVGDLRAGVDHPPPRDEIDPTSAVVAAGIDEPWARSFGVIHGGGATQEGRTAAYGRMLAAFGDRALAATVVDEQEATVGLGYGVLDRGWLGIFGMGTAPAHRRRGIASAIVRALADEATERGATRAYLQVETDNAAAIACYERLGFTVSHHYHYRSEGLDPTQGC